MTINQQILTKKYRLNWNNLIFLLTISFIFLNFDKDDKNLTNYLTLIGGH